MAAYTETKTYHTKAHMGMIDVTEDFRHAVEEAARQKNIRNGTITGFTTGGVAALTTLEFEPGLVGHDLKAALDVFSPYRDEKGRVIHYQHHDTWHDDNGSSHIKALLLSPFGVFSICIAAITAAICQSPDAHPDAGKRWLAAIAAGGFYLLAGIFGGSITGLMAALPLSWIQTLAGLALLGTISGSLYQALSHEAERDAAIVTFLTTASGVTLLGIGSAFWGLVLGGVCYALFSRARRA